MTNANTIDIIIFFFFLIIILIFGIKSGRRY